MEAAPPGQLSAPVLWAERLGGFDAAWLAARTALTGEEVRYDEHRASVHGLRIARFLGWREARLTLARADAKGDPLNDRREDLLAKATGGRGSAYKAYFAGRLLTRATFLVMAQAAAEPGREHRYFVVPHPANVLLARAFDVELKTRPGATEALRAIAAPLVLLSRAVLAHLTKPSVRHTLTGKPAVWVEYYHGDIGGFISRLFWKDHVDPERFDRVVYMDREDSPADALQTKRVEDFGFRWIDASKPWTLAGVAPRAALGLLAVLFKPGAPWWVRAFELHYEATVAVWEAAFRRYGVKVLSQHQELSWLPVAQTEAVERAGGAMMGLHWSDFPFLTEPTHPSPETVFFVWGVTNKRWLEGKGFEGRRILPCGMWLPDDPRTSVSLKMASDFTLAVFDSSYAYDIFYSAEMLADFMKTVLDLLDRHPGWKVTFKPKNPRLYDGVPGGRELMARVEAFRSSGRLALLDHGVSPVDAALAADLSVCFGFNSAGVVAAARGARAVHWDAAGWTKHPLREDPSQRILFKTLGELAAAVEAAPKDPGVGDFSRWRRLADYYGDRKAPERVGSWISAALADGWEKACAGYVERWGVDSSFEGPGRWWRD